MADRKPNVILIFCDDLGYGDLGCFGSKVNATPRLDQMAEEGMRFTDFYVAAPVCSPSRAALMTGCYPKRVDLAFGTSRGVLFPGDAKGLNPDEVTIASLLKTQGYATKLIGKWHLGDQPEFLPTSHGFDSYFGIPYSNDMLPHNANNKKNGFDMPHLPLLRDEKVVGIDPNQASLTDYYVEDAVQFIRDNKDGPFFLYFAHMYVHLPLYAPYRFLQQAQNGPYGAAVEHIDEATGVLLDTLAELGIDDNTLVIFTSDNGSNGRSGGSNGPLRGNKGSTWEGGMREPCMMRWPGKIPSGTTCSDVCTAMDMLPTLGKLAGAEMPDDRALDGKDIRASMFGEEGAASPYDAFFYYGQNNLRAVRSGQWKLHLEDEMLVDLNVDVGETTDVSGDHPDVVAQLKAHVERCRQDLGDEGAGVEGSGCRTAGWVDDPKFLTPHEYNPYVEAAYD